MNVALPPNPEQFTTWSDLEASDLVQTALRTNLEITLMHNYLTECAPWFDAHSAQLYYSRVEVSRMLKCPPWRAAALALSAKNIEMRDHPSLIPGLKKLSLHLYSMAVRLAIESMSGRFEVVGTVAGCVLLCVYEMMTLTYLDWRRHVQGCASMYTHNGWNGSSGGLISGCFWDFARTDMWAAFCSSTRTILPAETSFDEPMAIMALDDIDADLHACIAIWLTARVINLTADGLPIAESVDFHALKADMLKWEFMGGPSAQAVLLREPMQRRIILSLKSSSPVTVLVAIGHTQFYTAKVVLLEYEAAQRDADAAAALREEAYKYALIANGVVEINNHTACLVNSLQPVYACGRHMRTRSEKFATLELLAQIERKTGWKCGWRSDGLREI
ncbi:putative fungal transcription factor [Septoria linicola]|nr:putative fungal transcription factor [Septoria linicola]